MPTTLTSPLTLNIPGERLRPHLRGGLLPSRALHAAPETSDHPSRPSNRKWRNPAPAGAETPGKPAASVRKCGTRRWLDPASGSTPPDGPGTADCRRRRQRAKYRRWYPGAPPHGETRRPRQVPAAGSTAHDSTSLGTDPCRYGGLFRREIQQRITPPLASTVSFSIRTIARYV